MHGPRSQISGDAGILRAILCAILRATWHMPYGADLRRISKLGPKTDLRPPSPDMDIIPHIKAEWLSGPLLYNTQYIRFALSLELLKHCRPWSLIFDREQMAVVFESRVLYTPLTISAGDF